MSITDAVAKNKLGKFRIEGSLLHRRPQVILNLLKDILIVRAEFLFSSNATEYEYVGYSIYLNLTI